MTKLAIVLALAAIAVGCKAPAARKGSAEEPRKADGVQKAPVASPRTGSIEGVAAFVAEGKPAAGAHVEVLGTDRVATTDDAGKFTIDGVWCGTRCLELRHPQAIGTSLTLDVVPGVNQVKLEVISPREAYRRHVAALKALAEDVSSRLALLEKGPTEQSRQEMQELTQKLGEMCTEALQGWMELGEGER